MVLHRHERSAALLGSGWLERPNRDRELAGRCERDFGFALPLPEVLRGVVHRARRCGPLIER